MYTIQMNLHQFEGALRSIARFAGKDTTRPHLYGVLVEQCPNGEVTMVATNGHAIAIWQKVLSDLPFSTPETLEAKGLPEGRYENVSLLIPTDEVKRILRDLRKPAKNTEDLIHLAANPTQHSGSFRGCVTVSTELLGHRLTVSVADEQFPPWDKVMPDYRKPIDPTEGIAAAALDTSYVKIVAEAFAVAPRLSKKAALQVAFGPGPLAPTLFTSCNVPELSVVVMPLRVDDHPRLHWSPIRRAVPGVSADGTVWDEHEEHCARVDPDHIGQGNSEEVTPGSVLGSINIDAALGITPAMGKHEAQYMRDRKALPSEGVDATDRGVAGSPNAVPIMDLVNPTRAEVDALIAEARAEDEVKWGTGEPFPPTKKAPEPKKTRAEKVSSGLAGMFS